MRFLKPTKGFRINRHIGMLLFSAAVLSGQFFAGDIAYGLEAPVLPPSMLMASANSNKVEADVKAEKPAKVATKKEIKVAPRTLDDREVVVKNKDLNINPDSKSKSEIAKKDVPSSKTITNESLKEGTQIRIEPKTAPAVKENKRIDNSSIDNFKVVLDEKLSINENGVISSDKNNEVVVNKKETTTTSKPEPKVIKTVKLSSDAPKSDENQKKATKVNTVKPNNGSVASTENIVLEKKVSSAPKKVSKKVVDESVCPEGWDWFSTPLVFKDNGDGKMVIVADTKAPKIVIPAQNKPVVVKAEKAKEFKKIVEIEKPVTKVIDDKSHFLKIVEPVKAVDDFETVLAVEEDNKQEIELADYVEAKPFEAPAASVPAVEAENDVAEPIVAVTAQAAEPVVEESDIVVQDDTKEQIKEEIAVNSKNAEDNALFAAAAEKMARIKRLHAIEAENRANLMVKANRSASMVRMNKLINELINKTQDVNECEVKKDEVKNTEIAPMAPPAEEENINNDTTDKKSSENIENVRFRPYIGVFGPRSNRFVPNMNWRGGWRR